MDGSLDFYAHQQSDDEDEDMIIDVVGHLLSLREYQALDIDRDPLTLEVGFTILLMARTWAMGGARSACRTSSRGGFQDVTFHALVRRSRSSQRRHAPRPLEDVWWRATCLSAIGKVSLACCMRTMQRTITR